MEEFIVRAASSTNKKLSLLKFQKNDKFTWNEISVRKEDDHRTWSLEVGSGKSARRYQTAKEGKTKDNASYFVFFKSPDASQPTYEVCPIEECYNVSVQTRIDDFFTKVKSPLVRTRSKSGKLSTGEKIRYYLSANIDPEYIDSREDPDQVKGRFGVFATQPINKGDFVCDYAGDLISKKEAFERILQYEKKNLGSYVFDLKWNDKHYCLDATLPSGRLGRLINHSRKRPNCKVKRYTFEDRPHLLIMAIRDINPNEEILYDYGEQDEAAIKANPWLEET